MLLAEHNLIAMQISLGIYDDINYPPGAIGRRLVLQTQHK
jgi:hypothetical protein